LSAIGTFDGFVAAREAGGVLLRDLARRLLDGLVAIWILAGALVFIEPSPYEVAFLAVLAVALVSGVALYRSTLGLLFIFIGFIPFGLISVFQVRHTTVSDGLIFVAVTYFLLLTSYFVANYVAENPIRRMRIIVVAYTVAALISAVVGTLAYLGLLPASELFLLYGRARAMFNDPNVYGPFLVLPAMYALQRVLMLTGWQAIVAAGIYFVLFVGVFVSFSRAAWGHFAGSSVLVLLLCFFLVAKAHDKVRILILSLVGIASLMVLLAGLLSIPAVAQLFEIRTESQSYDTGATGRFGRQAYAFEVALRNPLGIGPQEFDNGPIAEAPHNTYVTVLHVYGWGGGLFYYLFVGATLWMSFASLARPSPLRPLMIPLTATYVMLIAEAAIIDTDHWRHYFLVAGLIWGVNSAIRYGPTTLSDPKAAFI
jgi:hypothetical protein